MKHNSPLPTNHNNLTTPKPAKIRTLKQVLLILLTTTLITFLLYGAYAFGKEVHEGSIKQKYNDSLKTELLKLQIQNLKNLNPKK